MARKNNFKLILFLLILFLSVFWPKRNLVQEWQEKKKIEAEINQWEEVLVNYPGYRDAYLKLAALYWQIHQQEPAREHFQKAKELDPNNEAVKMMEAMIESDQ